MAKRFLKSGISRLDKHNKDCAFRKWKDFKHQDTLMIMTEQQNELIGQMAETQQLEMTTADKLMKSKDKCARVS